MKKLINTVKEWMAVAYILTHKVNAIYFEIGDGLLEYRCGSYHIKPQAKDLWVYGKKEYHRLRNYAIARQILKRCFHAKFEFDDYCKDANLLIMIQNTTTNEEK